ncbi:MAG: segregation/condensation protein A [Candidatus Aenigmarchaeota archaeon]|nr:segregation/condensation protein A [Candidatus Aenigmarchaeota archaeon]
MQTKMNEQDLLKSVIETEAWEDVIYNIVSLEGLDPWDIDIVKLADSFLEYIKNIKSLDFRIPAKIVFVAAILLKLKTDTLFPKEKEEKPYIPEITEDEFKEIKERLDQIKLSPPIERMPTRTVTLDELVDALRKAMRVKERKEYRRHALGRKVVNNIDFSEEDIEIRINKLLGEIDSLIKMMKKDKIEFSKIVEKWNREEIIKHFLPLLYLANRGEVVTEQEDFFKEILISRKRE